MNRTQKSLLNAISAILLTLVNGLLGIVVTRFVISYYGSDFNGLNSTANQIINVLLILEGGFTLASNVALFEPLSCEDYTSANGILSATRSKFQRIGVIFLLVGTLVALAYSIAANTQLSHEFVFTIIFMAVVPQAVNLFYATTYRVLLQTQQKEYVISGFTAVTIGLGHIVNIILILYGGKMWMVRFVTMVFALINCFLISYYTKKKNDFIDFSVKGTPEKIKGTGDVLAQKITGVIYTSWPIVFLSISANGGTILASVYAVYNSVFVMIKALLHGIIDAPRLGFGQMLTEKKRENIWPSFREYEFVAVFCIFIMMVTSAAMILPFIKVYTRGVTDVNYYDPIIAIIMIMTGTIEMLHIPSGHIINMSGNFKVSKKYQIIACILLIISMFALGVIWGVYGMLLSLLLVSVLLAILEINYVHKIFFSNKIKDFIFLALPFIIMGIIASFLEMKMTSNLDGIINFLVFGVVFTLLNVGVALIIGLLFNKDDTKKIISRIQIIIKKTV